MSKANPSLTKQFRFGLRQRVVLVLFGGLLISLTINGWLLLQEQKNYTSAEIENHGTQLSQILSRSLANSVVGYDYHGIQLFIDQIISDDIQYIRVLSSKGNVMAETGKLVADQQQQKFFSEAIKLGDTIVGTLELAISAAPIIKKIEQQKNSLITREGMVILFILLIEFLALSYLIIRPLNRISDVFSTQYDEENFIPDEITLQRDDEFGDIAKNFNSMRKKLLKAHSALKGRIDIADHKLRLANEKLLKKSQELEEINRELKNQALTDPMTGCFNRRKFQLFIKNDLENLLNSGSIVSLILIDIDHFKNINDKHGHDVGDIVLQEVANSLSAGIRRSDILCRIGGEEFAIFCMQAGSSDAYQLADKLKENISELSIPIDGLNIRVTVSAGISTPGVGTTLHCPDCLYKQADIALYQSKSSGRNKVTHFHEVDLDLIDGFELEGTYDEKNTA